VIEEIKNDLKRFFGKESRLLEVVCMFCGEKFDIVVFPPKDAIEYRAWLHCFGCGKQALYCLNLEEAT